MRSTLLLLSTVFFSVQMPSAQETQEDVTLLILIKAKPGMTAQLEKGAKAHQDWHRNEKDDWVWTVWQYLTGEHSGTYVVHTGGHRWEDFDARADFAKADQARAQEDLGPYMESMQRLMEVSLPKLSHLPQERTIPPLINVITYRVKPGGERQFLEALQKVHSALMQAKWPRHYMVSAVRVGAAPGFTIVVPLQNWADMRTPEKGVFAEMSSVYGKLGAEKIRSSLYESVQSSSSDILVYRPDLSYIPSSGQPADR